MPPPFFLAICFHCDTCGTQMVVPRAPTRRRAGPGIHTVVLQALRKHDWAAERRRVLFVLCFTLVFGLAWSAAMRRGGTSTRKPSVHNTVPGEPAKAAFRPRAGKLQREQAKAAEVNAWNAAARSPR